MGKGTSNPPVDFSVVGQPYTALKHLDAVKKMSNEAIRLCDALWEQSVTERKVFQERTVENSPVMFHGWEVDVDPEDGVVSASRIVGDIEECRVALVADGNQKAHGRFQCGDEGDDCYIYLHVTSDTAEESLTATLLHELTHYFDHREGRMQPVDRLAIYLKHQELHDNDILKIYGDAMYVLWSPAEIRAFTAMLAVKPGDYANYLREVYGRLRDFGDKMNDFLCHFGNEEYDRQSQALDGCFMDKDGVLEYLKTPGGFVHMSERYALPAIHLAKKTVLAQIGEEN